MWNGSSVGLSGGKPGYLPYWSSGNTLSTSTIYLSTSTRNIGIGTTTPDSMLEPVREGGPLLGLSVGTEGQFVKLKNSIKIFGIYDSTSSSSPEGVKLANTGSLLINSSSGNIYIKTTDETTTGWQKIQREADILNRVSGWVNGGTISINGGDNTKIDITAGEAEFVDYTDPNKPIVKRITLPNQVALYPGFLGDGIRVGVRDNGSGGVEFVYYASFDSIKRKSIAYSGRVRNSNGIGAVITNVYNYKTPAYGVLTANNSSRTTVVCFAAEQKDALVKPGAYSSSITITVLPR